MSQFDYSAPVKFEPPPPRERKPFPRWILIVIGVVALLLLIGYLGFNALINRGREMLKASLPPAAVHVGQPRQWRVLDEMKFSLTSRGGALGSLLCSDYDADGDDEILRIGYLRGSKFYEADGTAQQVALQGMEYIFNSIAWDYDRDGIAEIVLSESFKEMMQRARKGKIDAQDDYSYSDYFLVLNLAGDQLDRIKGGGLINEFRTADVTGNGFDELLAPDPEASYRQYRFLVFGNNGKKLKSITTGTFGSPAVGDFDNDGLEELMVIDLRSSSINASGYKQETVACTGWPKHERGTALFVDTVGCADLNGDGFAELLAGYHGFYDAGSSGYTSFSLPEGIDTEGSALGSSVAVGNFSQGAELEVAVSGMMGGAVLEFNYEGNCTYYEELGDMVWGIATISSGGQDYLVVQLMEKLLIYP